RRFDKTKMPEARADGRGLPPETLRYRRVRLLFLKEHFERLVIGRAPGPSDIRVFLAQLFERRLCRLLFFHLRRFLRAYRLEEILPERFLLAFWQGRELRARGRRIRAEVAVGRGDLRMERERLLV